VVKNFRTRNITEKGGGKRKNWRWPIAGSFEQPNQGVSIVGWGKQGGEKKSNAVENQ